MADGTPNPQAPAENFTLDGGASGGMDEIERIMTHDPFSSPKEGDAPPVKDPASNPPAQPTPAPTPGPTPQATPAPAPAPQPQPAPGATPGAAPAPQAPTPTPVPDPGLGQVVQQLQTIAEGFQRPQPAAPAEDDLPAYEVDIPDQLLSGLASENPAERKVATAHLVKGVGRLIHKTVREDFAKAIPNIINHYIRQYDAQRSIFEDFYGQHKDLNRPELRQDVVTAVGLMMQTGKYRGWSPELRDAVAQHVRTARGIPAPGTPAPAPAAAPTPAPAAPHVFTPGARPSAPQPNDQQAQMLDLLVFGH